MQLKTKMIVGSVLSLILLSTVYIVGWEYSDSITNKRYEEAVINGRAALWKKVISQQYEKMRTGSKQIKSNTAITDSLLSEELEPLKSTAQKEYNTLNSAGVVSNLSIVNADGAVVFSAKKSNPGQYDPLVQYVLENKRARHDVIKDATGRSELAFAFPLYANNQVVGAGIHIKSLSKAVVDFSKTSSTTSYILTPQGQKSFGAQGKFYQVRFPVILKSVAFALLFLSHAVRLQIAFHDSGVQGQWHWS